MATPGAAHSARTFSVDSGSASFLGRRTTATSYGTRRGTRILTCDEFELEIDDYLDTTTATGSQSITHGDEDIAILADDQQQPPQQVSTPSARPSMRRHASSAARTVRSSDQQLLAMAVEASEDIPWDTIRGDLLTAASQWKREKVTIDADAAVFSRKDSSAHTLSILGVGEMPCCVQELLQVFYVERTSEYMDIMRSIHGKNFLHGELVHNAGLQHLSHPQRSGGTRSKRSGTLVKPPENIQLTVKTLTFDKASMFRRNEEWLFVELMEQRSDPHRQRVAFAKTLKTFNPGEVLSDSDWGQAVNKPRHAQDVVIGYRFDEEPNGRSTRVQFFAEHKLSGSHGSSAASYRMVKSRLLQLAQTSPALMHIIRRRRLGLQVLAHSSLAVSATSRSRCARCTQSFAMLKKKRICNLCGHLVCEKCSGMQERERTTQSRSHIDSVRVCRRCLERVDAGQFRNVSKQDLKSVRVQDDGSEYASSNTGSQKKPRKKQHRQETLPRASTMEPKKSKLALILEETLRTASDSKKLAVLNVMQDLLEQEPYYQRASVAPPPPIVLSPDQSLEDQIDAFTMELKIHNLPLQECVLANSTARSYAISPGEDPTTPLPKPISPCETHRLELVKQLRIKELNETPELDIICAMAAKELDCAASLVTIVDEDQFHVVASNIEQYAHHTLPRHEGFCMQLIMDDKPLVVPHPEADIRFSQLRVVVAQQCNFYCGFPLRAADNTVIGSVCCVDPRSRELTRTQYSAMMRLADTASKIVQRSTTATH